MAQNNICILTPDMSMRGGGVYEAILGQAYALRDARLNLSLISLMEPVARAALPEHLAVQHKHTHGLGVAGRFFGVANALEQSGARVAHSHGLWFPSISLALQTWKHRTGGAVLLSPHGMLDPWALRNSLWKKKLAMALYEGRAIHKADCLHALNFAEKNAIRAMGARNPVAVIPNGVTLPEYRNKIKKPEFLIKDDRRVLLFLGRIHPKKGVEETVAAWGEAQLKTPTLSNDWVLVMAGWDDGGHIDNLKRQCAALGIEDSVLFPGPMFGESKKQLLSHSDAFILASHSEGLPMAVLEAWAYGLPVLMSSACNLSEGFEAGAAVEVSTDPAEMAKSIIQTLTDPNLPQVGAAGKTLVAERFTWDSIGLDLAAVYAWLAGRGPRPDCVHLT